jgi:hypothetical protein
MRTQRVQIKEVQPWLVPWASTAGTKDFCPALDALVGPVQNIFFLTADTILIHLFPSPSTLGSSRAGPPVS